MPFLICQSKDCYKLRLWSTDSDFYDYFANDVQGPTLKQLFISDSNVSKFASYAKYFPNLRRLHIQDFPLYPFEDKLYTGPVLEKLEILEICFHAQAEVLDHYHGFSLADHCPILKSAFHFIQTGEQFFVNTGIKNHFLKDLIIEFYPNLKHLAIRKGKSISDEIIPELLGLLPRIILIDIRNSKIITQKSTDYIDWYCRQHNRSISFYYKNRPKISKKWPHLSTKRVFIGRGFDFMKYCFLRRLNELPPLLDPEESITSIEMLPTCLDYIAKIDVKNLHLRKLLLMDRLHRVPDFHRCNHVDPKRLLK
uniref:F-box domain-containing protein n=1 Tax=Tetranychus urticae TaxID=32264 RepID=T1K704_TETUR